MKRLVLCFDGTWNAVQDPDTVTNVVKLAEAVRPTAKDGVTQPSTTTPVLAAAVDWTDSLVVRSALGFGET